MCYSHTKNALKEAGGAREEEGSTSKSVKPVKLVLNVYMRP
jgi:hypothetical protein